MHSQILYFCLFYPIFSIFFISKLYTQTIDYEYYSRYNATIKHTPTGAK